MPNFDPTCQYRPYDKGVYQVAPLLRPMGTSFGHADEIEKKYFQIDPTFAEYRKAKLQSYQNYSYHFGESRITPEQKWCLVEFICQRLALEHPQHFQIENNPAPSAETLTFTSSLTKESFDLSIDNPQLDKLTLLFQEDIAAWTYQGEDDWMAYASICFPNHWAPEDKIGRDFFAVHEPIAGAGPMLKSSKQLVEAMVHKGPFVRFAWGISTDTLLNHHPTQAPPGRKFDPQTPQLWVRSERQTLHGFPEQKLAFFSIRTYFEDVHQIKQSPEHLAKLKEALLSMSPESQIYKGLAESLDSILIWLDA